MRFERAVRLAERVAAAIFFTGCAALAVLALDNPDLSPLAFLVGLVTLPVGLVGLLVVGAVSLLGSAVRRREWAHETRETFGEPSAARDPAAGREAPRRRLVRDPRRR